MNQNSFRKLISGSSTGPVAVLLRLLLRVPALVYSIAVALRNLLYSKGRLKIHSVDVPVISIGNITVGGTGKTPLVIWLCNFLREKDIACAILTRGYKTGENKLSDEPAILAKSCPDAKVIVNPNRLAAAHKAISYFGAKVLVMDDGFQHRRLHRDLDIVTIDAMRPFGSDKMLPAGLLREPISSLKRAHAAVITRCDQTTQTELAQIEDKLKQTNPDLIIARSIHTPLCVKSLGNNEIGLEELKDKRIFAFCGIGNPDSFLDTLKRLGTNLLGSIIYNDHHRYSKNNITDIYEQAVYLNADLILATQKDWTKIIGNPKLNIADYQDIPFAYLLIKLKFLDGQDKLKQLIEDALAGKITEK